MWKGSFVALVTPMDERGDLDLLSLENLLEYHLNHNTDGIVLLGSTGEYHSLFDGEKLILIKRAVDIIAGQIPLIIGCNENGTNKTTKLVQKIAGLGVDAIMCATPAYLQPTQPGLIKHFIKISQATDLPIFLHNIPSRTACNLEVESILQLAELDNILGIKEASGNIKLVEKLSSTKKDFIVFAGNDHLAIPMIKAGASGSISVAANIAPELVNKLISCCLSKKFVQAEQIEQKLKAIYHNLFVETNPIPVKWMLYKLGLIESGIRLPLTELSAELRVDVAAELNKLKI